MRKLIYFLLLITAIILLGFWAADRKEEQPGKISVFFPKNGQILPVERALPADKLPEEQALESLLKGPSAQEKAEGFFTEIPSGTRGKVVLNEGGVITIDFSKELGQYGGGTARVQALLSQIVLTFSDIKGIDSVKLLISGKEGPALGSEGFVIEKPLSKRDIQGN